MPDKKLTVIIAGNAKGLTDTLGVASSKLSDFGSKAASVFKTAALGIGAVGVAAVIGAKPLIDAASNLSESMSKVDVVFGSSAKEIQEWSKASASAFGQSRQSALEAVGTYGNLFQAFGIGRDQSAKMSKSLVELAADLASFNNTSVDDALQALQSGISGETEPLKRYGVAINDNRLKTEALRLGLIKTTKEALTPAAKAQASYALILKDTTLAQGDFARTSDGLANKQRILAAKFQDLKATLGTALLPVALKLADVFGDLLGGITAFVAAFKAGDGEITSKGFAGFMERVAIPARKIFVSLATGVRAFADGFRGGPWEQGSAFQRGMNRIGIIYRDVFGWIKVNVPPALAAVSDFIRNDVIPVFERLAHWAQDKLAPAIGKVVEALRDSLWPVVRDQVLPALRDLAAWIGEHVLPVVAKFTVFMISDMLPMLIRIQATIMERVIPAVRSFVGWIRDDLIPAVEKISKKIADFATTLAGWVVDVWKYGGMVIDFFRELNEKIGAPFSKIAETLIAPFRTAFAEIQSLYNKTLGSIPGVPKMGGKSVADIASDAGIAPAADPTSVAGLAKKAGVPTDNYATGPQPQRSVVTTAAPAQPVQVSLTLDGQVLGKVLIPSIEKASKTQPMRLTLAR